MHTFQEMNLPRQLQRALEAMNFVSPTPIQVQAIPVAMAHHDVIGCAQTGTGKTGAFGVPMVVRLLQQPQETALILAPTRELAVQIVEFLIKLTQYAPELNHALLIGGMSMSTQLRALQRRPRIIVATPGRLVDHLQRRAISLQNTGILVLDEADRMLDMGFAPQLNEILRYLPTTRQTMLFSATLPDNILGLANRYLKNPVRINAGSVDQPVQKIHHSVVQTTPEAKNDVLLDELNTREGSVLIFTRTKHRTDRVAKFLSKFGYTVCRLHGDRTQSQRDAAIKGFRVGTFRILVATDIAARGLDIPHIAHVINYDLPQQPEDYVHRIGRTARAGAEGEAICLLVPEDQGQWRRIARLYLKDEGPAHAKKAPVIERRPKSPVSLDNSLPEQRPRIIPRVQR
ncbi:MAG TPA: DEAD/DEAH box helicase [Oligoflexus sp.]|uniref:DEAD/DEAH box helicase n=1 Tax=Oligoflexus sp. TaxID=1971216 RepID=UPI002D447EDD|nr:DEAD/DEAH box helicase [Oligoflexus sp.]HYX34625.1 DEAD/DEAH box helicase [Oligoflexus sp.]